jgi:para-aminobenzoate synthetase/4-amino-4-deoxychorismate lyase
MNDFQLIETLRVLDGGRVYLLDRHLARLKRSADFFSFRCDVSAVRDAVLGALPKARAVCLRLTLSQDGSTSIERFPPPSGYVKRLKLSAVRVNSSDPFLYHKTTRRSIYDEAKRECGDDADALLVNERDEVTETTIMNIAVHRDGRWITPRVSCGLLAGVMREEMLAKGEVVEGVIHTNDLQPGELVRCFNALRGVHDVGVVLSSES